MQHQCAKGNTQQIKMSKLFHVREFSFCVTVKLQHWQAGDENNSFSFSDHHFYFTTMRLHNTVSQGEVLSGSLACWFVEKHG